MTELDPNWWNNLANTIRTTRLEPLVHEMLAEPMPESMRDRIEMLHVEAERWLCEWRLDQAFAVLRVLRSMRLEQFAGPTYRVWVTGTWGKNHSNWCRVAVNRGGPVSWSSYETTDEGWNAWGWTLSVDEQGIVHKTTFTDGVDCDGRLSSTASYVCHGQALTEHDIDHDPYHVPLWRLEHREQRDYQAEAAGY